jgi:hypothetical protein
LITAADGRRSHVERVIVEDDASVLRLLKRSLAEYHLVTAQCGAEALVLL